MIQVVISSLLILNVCSPQLKWACNLSAKNNFYIIASLTHSCLYIHKSFFPKISSSFNQQIKLFKHIQMVLYPKKCSDTNVLMSNMAEDSTD